MSKEKKKKEQPSTSTPKITSSSTAKNKAVASSASTKQTLNYLKPEDYVHFPIETLQALETQIPPLQLTGKSWADIAEESEDDKPLTLSKSQLNQLIAKKQQEALVVNKPAPKKKAASTPNFSKLEQVINLAPLLPEIWDENPWVSAERMFSKNWHFVPENVLKDRRFYELILVESNSVKIKHHPEDDRGKTPKDKTHSTFRIEKILSLRDWGIPPYEKKKFSINWNPTGYTYWDYIKAWEYTLWFQNQKFSHTWLIFFNQSVKYHFPPWFIIWWFKFGPVPDIYPTEVKEGFEVFKDLFNNEAFGNLPIQLQFFARIGLPWVYQWKYQFSEKNKFVVPFLQRLGMVRWWANCQHGEKAHKVQVLKWFEKNPHYHKSLKAGQCQFLQNRSQAISALSSVSTQGDFISNLEEILLQLKSQSQDSQSSSHTKIIDEEDVDEVEDSEDVLTQSNEDDCYGVEGIPPI